MTDISCALDLIANALPVKQRYRVSRIAFPVKMRGMQQIEMLQVRLSEVCSE